MKKLLPFVGLAAGGGVLVIVSLTIGYVAGSLSARAPASQPAGTSDATEEASAQKKVRWTCSMHPQIIQLEPGLCPI